jgi:hypothetical protein
LRGNTDLKLRTKIILGVVAFFLVLTAIGAIAAAITPMTANDAAPSGAQSSATPVTTAPPTPQPLTRKQRIQAIVDSIDNLSQYNPVVTYDAADVQLVVVTFNPGEIVGGYTLPRMWTFDIEKAIWTSNTHLIKEVDVNIRGPFSYTDAYGKVTNSTGVYTSVKLTQTTAAKFVWANLDQDSAWAAYDSTWAAPSLSN